VRGGITRQRSHGVAPGLAPQHLAQQLHRRLFQRVLQADQEVVLFRQRHEVQPELAGRRGDAQARIAGPAGHRCGHGQVAVLVGQAVAHQLGRRHAGLLAQVLQQQPRARTRLAVHEARAQCRHIGQAVQAAAGCRLATIRPCQRRAPPISLCRPGLSRGLSCAANSRETWAGPPTASTGT
jgi:hypothetical protein